MECKWLLKDYADIDLSVPFSDLTFSLGKIFHRFSQVILWLNGGSKLCRFDHGRAGRGKVRSAARPRPGTHPAAKRLLHGRGLSNAAAPLWRMNQCMAGVM
jgi:hypothetical protein